ncbi:MAG: ABC transporter ATP-binding protein [Myxococcales bacterium]|nr:ABC transporter ATP-binding protein [Myxococcales bacterium]
MNRVRLRSFLRPHAGRLAWGTLLLLVTNLLDKSIPFMLKLAVDGFREDALDQVKRYALWVILIAASMWAIRAYSRVVVFNIGRDVEYDLRNAFLRRLHALGFSFFQRMPTGEVMSRATNDVTQLRLLVGFGLLNVVNTIFAFGLGIGLMWMLSPDLTLYALAPYPFVIVVTLAFSHTMFKRSMEAQEALGGLAEVTQENLAGIRVVRSFGLERRERDRFERKNADLIRANMRLVIIRALMWPLLVLIGSVATVLVIYVGGSKVAEGTLTPGDLTAFLGYLAQLTWPTMALGFLVSVVQRGRASWDRVREVLEAQPDVVEAEHPLEAPREGAIVVRDLEFSRDGRKVLDGVDLEIPAGASVAIVGAVGSGKSTLAALLPRLLPTPKGAVFLDGKDVTDLELRSLRRAVGYAQQEPFLFSTTVERNIALALPDPDAPDARERVREAAREAAIEAEIDALPDGFDTFVGERGVQLSGGQKQRISLARALLNKPSVIVLDDPLSAVDARTEKQILEALDRAGEGRTLVLVTHRVAAARRADEIVVLAGGRVVERGTHETLSRKEGGVYATLAKRQRLELELESL